MNVEYYIYLWAKKEERYKYKSHSFGALLLAVNDEKKKIPNQLVKAIIYNGNVVKILVSMKELNYFVERNSLAYFLLRMYLLSCWYLWKILFEHAVKCLCALCTCNYYRRKTWEEKYTLLKMSWIPLKDFRDILKIIILLREVSTLSKWKICR